MVQALTVCNNIIKKSIQENIELTPLKLQKIIYFIYGYGMYKKNKKLFKAEFYAWRYGPVCESVYDEFKSFGNQRITRYSQDAKGISYFVNENNVDNIDLLNCIDFIWNKYKRFSGMSLVKLTHERESAWNRTVTNGRIDDKTIVDDFEKGLY